MKYITTKLLIATTAILLTQNSCNNNTASTATKPTEQDKFVGAWASNAAGAQGMSLFIEKTGEIYNCYFIGEKGDYRNYKGIIENNDIKIGKDFTIKFLNENKEIYLVERAQQFQKMQSIEDKLKEIQKDIKEIDGANVTNFMFVPFADDEANQANLTPNFSITMRDNIYEKGQKLFDKNIKDCFLSPKLVGHYDLEKENSLEKDEAVKELFNNWLLPWEYSVSCKNATGRDMTFVFSIRYNEYKIVRIQFFS